MKILQVAFLLLFDYLDSLPKLYCIKLKSYEYFICFSLRAFEHSCFATKTDCIRLSVSFLDIHTIGRLKEYDVL